MSRCEATIIAALQLCGLAAFLLADLVMSHALLFSGGVIFASGLIIGIWKSTVVLSTRGESQLTIPCRVVILVTSMSLLAMLGLGVTVMQLLQSRS